MRRSNPSGREADPRRTIPLNSSAWRKLRAYFLAHDPLCRHCKSRGMTVLATDIDHMSGDPSDNSAANLQPLCHSCHSHKTGRERHGLSVVMGCNQDGWPADPSHHWNQKNR